MNALRFSLAKLLGAVVVVALGLGALVNATPLWAGLSTAAVIFMLLVGVVGTVYRRGVERAFWLGFAVFGWTFVAHGFLATLGVKQDVGISRVLSFLHQLTARYAPLNLGKNAIVVWEHADGTVWMDDRRIKPDQLIPELQQQIQRRGSKDVVLVLDPNLPNITPVGHALNNAQDAGMMQFRDIVRNPILSPTEANFKQVGNSLASLLMAFLGGLIARYFYATRERTT